MADSFYDVMPVQQQAVAATAATAAAEPAAAAAGGGAAAGTLVAPQIDMTAINGTLHATQVRGLRSSHTMLHSSPFAPLFHGSIARLNN